MSLPEERRPRLYHELADWWPLLSPPQDYGEEADDLLGRLGGEVVRDGATLLELGAGGGSLAYHLKRRFSVVLTDLSPAMVAVSRAVNPECDHIVGDMRTLRVGRRFDVVLIHDAIVYATDEQAVRDTLRTAAIHCRSGGRLALLPDHTRETFEPGTDHGGHDAPDGRGLRYLEWTWDPDPEDDTYTVDYALMLRTASGAVAVEHDRHVEGLFSRQRWVHWLGEAGFSPRVENDGWGRDVFLGVRR